MCRIYSSKIDYKLQKKKLKNRWRCGKNPPHFQTISTYWNFWLDLPVALKGYLWDAVVQHHFKIHTKKLWRKHGGIRNSVQDISSYGSCQGSFIHLLCLFESLQPSCHVNPHLHSHLSSACGSASNHLGVCCLHFTASLIDLASSVSWGDLLTLVGPIWIHL